MTEIFIRNAAIVATLMVATWTISLMLRNASIIDIVWGLGFVLIAWSTGVFAPVENRSLLLPFLTTIWGLRLSLYLAWRNHGKPEDHRYASMRERHGDNFGLVSLLTVFALQGMVMWIVSLPVQTSECRIPEQNGVVAVGLAIWLTGFLFELIGDWQLARFRKNPENHNSVMDRGLWRFTRHPNYFGDFCVWWGFFLTSLSSGTPVWTVASPLLMSILLLKVSGVTLLEKTLVNRRPGYAEYVRRTSSFFPMPARNLNSPE